jgi:hypothetical protein
MAFDYCEAPRALDKYDVAAIIESYSDDEPTLRQFEDGWVVAYAPHRKFRLEKPQEQTLEERFHSLASAWSDETMHLSSVSATINNRHYQEIIDMGWDVLPVMLDDLRSNKRFWFPALAAITGIRPFDSNDLSNPRRMAEAWIRWGKNKGLI